MKKILLLTIVLISSVFSNAQVFHFPTKWKIKLEDNEAFRLPSYNDADWQLATVPMSWGKQEINKEKTIGWYRVSFSLPDNLLGKDLMLYCGAIDDADETYFNGVLIGNTGKFPQGDQSAWDIERKYLVKKSLVKKQNTIAIRVYNGIGDGGLHSGRLALMTKAENDRQVAGQLRSKKSYYQLTTSNGLISAVYNAETDVVENVYPHIFSYYDSGFAVMPFVQNIKPITNQKPLSVSYLKNTHIIQVKYNGFDINYVAPFTIEEKVFVAMVKGNPQAIKNFRFETGRPDRLVQEQFISSDKKFFLFYYNGSISDPKKTLAHIGANLKIKAKSFIEEELHFMQSIFASAKMPKGISANERSAIEQGISILKMSQVSDKEIFPLSHGQVLASLRPGVWAIAWVRDGAFAIEAMSKLGMYAEAKKGLEFMLKAKPTNQYINYVHTDRKDYGIGVPYIISVTRYFGNGREESDFDDRGPNIEIDDFGLFLTALYHYVNQSNDKEFFLRWKNEIDTIGRAIIHNINEKGIIRQDSGPWEHHLPGKEFMWASGVCARGLQLMAILQKRFGMPSNEFEAGYQRLYKGIMDNCLVDGKYIKGNATEQSATDHHYFDAATFELFANGLINDKKLFATHMAEYNKHNRAANDPARGYIRFNSNDSYENQEWPFAGLRVAVAQKQLGSNAEAKKLIDRITLFASRNNNQVPEILSNDLNLYRGAIPMVGYGSGAYILALLNYYKQGN